MPEGEGGGGAGESGGESGGSKSLLGGTQDKGGGTGSSGGAPASWLDSLPPEYKSEACLQQIKDIPTLAKSYISSQKMIGADKVALPGKNATPEQWNEFYSKVGRPETHDKYGDPDYAKIAPNIQVDKAQLAEVKKTFHGLGLSDAQARGVLEMYYRRVDGELKAKSESTKAMQEASVSELKREYGEKWDAKLQTAQGVLKKFGDEGGEFTKFLDESGLGNDVRLIRLLTKVGEAMLEDTAKGRGPGLAVGEAAAAAAEIKQLSMDEDFQRALNTANHAGHRDAVDKWYELHRQAHPEEKKRQ
jgi:hypothetical protein